ncbi:MAG TPA: alpha/beta hydrolase [Chitinophagaceae bacterium]
MVLQQFSYRNSTIGYYRFGSGPKPAFCFHGYGEDATIFGFLAKYAGDQYTFYSIDLPFHGKTAWKEGVYFGQKDLLQIVEEILNLKNKQPSFAKAQEDKSETNNQKLSLIGFSLGGRIALSLFQVMPEKVEKLVLLAPDGLKVNFWYWLSTQTWLGKKVFRLTMNHPGWFFSLLKMLNTLKLVNASIFKFVSYYIGDAKVRQLLYDRWIAMRKLKPDLKRIKSFIRTNNTKVRLVYGRHDRIILSTVGEKFRKGIEDHCILSVIHSGHQVLHEKHISELLPALLH